MRRYSRAVEYIKQSERFRCWHAQVVPRIRKKDGAAIGNHKRLPKTPVDMRFSAFVYSILYSIT